MSQLLMLPIGPFPRDLRRELRQRKRLVVIAVEESARGVGRIRLGSNSKTSRKQLRAFVEVFIEPESLIPTDGNSSCGTLCYRHSPTTLLHIGMDSARAFLLRIRRVVSLLKRWLVGAHHLEVTQRQCHAAAHFAAGTVQIRIEPS